MASNSGVCDGRTTKFGIRSIPTIILFKDGENVQQFVGAQQEGALVAAIESAE